MKSHRNCLLCFTPPYMLERIIEAGSAGQKDRALKVLTLSGQMRGRRQSLTRVKFPFPRTLKPGKQRYVYSADYGSDLPGTVVRREKDPPSGDSAVDEAFDGAGITYDLFLDHYERNSIDDAGMHLISTVHLPAGI